MMKQIDKVLLVDDDRIANHINKLLIEEMQFTKAIDVAMNGQLALDYVNKHCLKTGTCNNLLLFLDINMPVMDGFEFLEEYDQLSGNIDKENIHIVLLTSSSNKKDVEKAKNFKVSGYINKPLTEEKVKDLMGHLLPG